LRLKDVLQFCIFAYPCLVGQIGSLLFGKLVRATFDLFGEFGFESAFPDIGLSEVEEIYDDGCCQYGNC
jgi:hypothetical protein